MQNITTYITPPAATHFASVLALKEGRGRYVGRHVGRQAGRQQSIPDDYHSNFFSPLPLFFVSVVVVVVVVVVVSSFIHYIQRVCLDFFFFKIALEKVGDWVVGDSVNE